MLNNKPVLIILSLAISLSLWLYVTGQVDPETKAKVNDVPVTIMNEEQLAVQDLAVVQDDALVTGVTLQGKRSYVNRAKKGGEIKAFVDVSDAKEGVNELGLEFETPTGVTIEGAPEAVVSVTVEERVSKEVPVKITFSGGGEGELIPWATEVYPDTITASGAKSSVDALECAVAGIEAADVTETAKNVEAEIGGRSTEGLAVRGLDFSRDSVMATVMLLDTAEVGVEYEATGLRAGFETDGITGPQKVRIVGATDTLADLGKVTAKVDLSDVEDAGVVERAIEFELPYGVYLYEDIKDNAKITVVSAE